MWDTQTGERRKPLTGHKNPIAALAVSPDGRILASGSARSPSFITGKTLLDPNAGGSVKDDVFLWDLEKNQLIGKIPTDQLKVTGLAFSPDGKTLATGYWVPKNTGLGVPKPVVVSLWDVETRQLQFNLEFTALDSILPQPEVGLAFNSVDGTLATGAGRTVLIWKLKTRKSRELPAVAFPNALIKSASYSPDGKTLLVSGWGGLTNTGWTIVYDLRTGTQTNQLRETGSCAIFTPDGKTVITQGREKIEFRNPSTLQPIAYLPARTATAEPMQNLLVSPDGLVLAQASADFEPFDPQHPEAPIIGKLSIRLWELSRPREVGTLRENVGQVRFTPDSKTAIGVVPQDVVKFIDIETLLVRSAMPTGRSLNMASYELAPNGRVFAVTGGVPRQNTAVEADVFDAHTGSKIREIKQEGGGYSTMQSGLAFAPDSNTLAIAVPPAASAKPVANPHVAVTFWNVADGKLLRTIHVPVAAPGPNSGKAILMYSPDGTALILRYISEVTVIELSNPTKIVKLVAPKELANEKGTPYAGFVRFTHNDTRVVGQYSIITAAAKIKYVPGMWDRQTGQLVDGPIPDIFPDPNKREIVSPNGRYEWKADFERKMIDRWAKPPVLVSPPTNP